MTIEAATHLSATVHDEHDNDKSPEANAIPVRLVETQKETPAVGSFQSYTFLGTEGAQQILPQTDRRNRAFILVTANNAVAQSVKFGRRNQASNNQGFLVSTTTSFSFVYEAGSEVWVMPQAVNGAVTVSVIDEWYLTGGDD